MTISVIANIKAKSDQKETLEALLKSVIEPTLKEEGCLKYEGEFKHEVRQFEKSYDNQQAEQISLMV